MKYWKGISGFLLAFCLIFLQISPVLASGEQMDIPIKYGFSPELRGL